jgi:hypothetical protein
MIRLVKWCHPECEYCLPFCHHKLVARFRAECRARELELDLEREWELNPYEEIPVTLEDSFYCEMYYR